MTRQAPIKNVPPAAPIIAAAPATSRDAITNFFMKVGTFIGVRAEGGGATLAGLALTCALAVAAFLFFLRRKRK